MYQNFCLIGWSNICTLDHLDLVPKYFHKVKELRNECERWMKEVDDKGHIPEEELIKMFWPNKIQPVTSNPIIQKVGDSLVVTCQTKGANIGYKYLNEYVNPLMGWRPYSKPIPYEQGLKFEFKAHRIGFLQSERIIFQNEN